MVGVWVINAEIRMRWNGHVWTVLVKGCWGWNYDERSLEEVCGCSKRWLKRGEEEIEDSVGEPKAEQPKPTYVAKGLNLSPRWESDVWVRQRSFLPWSERKWRCLPNLIYRGSRNQSASFHLGLIVLWLTLWWEVMFLSQIIMVLWLCLSKLVGGLPGDEMVIYSRLIMLVSKSVKSFVTQKLSEMTKWRIWKPILSFDTKIVLNF